MSEQLFGNIFISGGNCNIRGFKTRIEQELESLKPSDMNVRVNQVDQPEFAVWRGLRQFAQGERF